MAHIGVGAFHRCHQAEFTDDLLDERFDRWGVVGINIREPRLARHSGVRTVSTPACFATIERVDARVIGCIVSTIDGQESSDAALRALAAAEIDVDHADGDREGLLPQAGDRRTRCRPVRYRA